MTCCLLSFFSLSLSLSLFFFPFKIDADEREGRIERNSIQSSLYSRSWSSWETDGGRGFIIITGWWWGWRTKGSDRQKDSEGHTQTLSENRTEWKTQMKDKKKRAGDEKSKERDQIHQKQWSICRLRRRRHKRKSCDSFSRSFTWIYLCILSSLIVSNWKSGANEESKKSLCDLFTDNIFAPSSFLEDLKGRNTCSDCNACFLSSKN